PSLTSTISCPPAIGRSSSAAISARTLFAPLYTGITIDSAKRASSGSALLGSCSPMDSSSLRSKGEHRAAKREPQSRLQKQRFEGRRYAAQCVNRVGVCHNIAGRRGPTGNQLTRDRHHWKQQGIPIGRVDTSEAGCVQKPGQTLDGVAPYVVHGSVMS